MSNKIKQLLAEIQALKIRQDHMQYPAILEPQITQREEYILVLEGLCWIDT